MGGEAANNENRRSKVHNKRKVGSIWEKYTGSRLKAAGLQIIAYNFRCRIGEIDIIARDGDYIVFTEVKCRKSKSTGNPLEAVTAYKQRRIRRVASFFCCTEVLKRILHADLMFME